MTFQDLTNDTLDIIFFTNVALNSLNIADIFQGLFCIGQLVHVPTGNDNLATQGEQFGRDGFANAGSTSGDQSNFSLEQSWSEDTHSGILKIGQKNLEIEIFHDFLC